MTQSLRQQQRENSDDEGKNSNNELHRGQDEKWEMLIQDALLTDGNTVGQMLKSNNMCCWLSIPEVGKPKHQPGTHRRGPPHSQPGTSCCHCPLPKTWREGKRRVRPTATNDHFKIHNTSSPVFFLHISVFLNTSEMKKSLFVQS